MIRFAAAVAVLPLTAQAQSFDDAVRANTTLAFRLCLDVMIARTLPVTAFGGAGFKYRAVNRGVNSYGVDLGLGHYFDAPADTAKAEVADPQQVAGICTVTTTHLSKPDLDNLLAAALFQSHPGTQVSGEGNWIVPTQSGLPLIINTRLIGTNHRYETPGTVSVSMSYPG